MTTRRSHACVVIVGAAFVAVAAAQLDDRWTVTVNGQTVAANADGSFTIPNIAAADAFGPGGPGTAPDFLSDDALRVIATGVIDGVTYYGFNTPFQLPNGTLVIDPATLGFTEIPPVLPVSVQLSTPAALLEVGQTTPLTTLARLADGSLLDLTTAYTTYRLSNPTIAGIDARGVLDARAAGATFVTAVNGGATAVLRIDVVSSLTTSTLDGFTVLADGRPVSGAALTTPLFGGAGASDAQGHFAFPVTAGVDSLVQINANAVVDGVPHRGLSASLPLMVGGLTDVGLIKLFPLGGSSGLFDAPRYFPLPFGYQNGNFVLADFDGDGIIDIGGSYVTSDFPYTYALGIQRGVGDGTFEATPTGTITTVNFSQALAAADFNGDGQVDLAGVAYDTGRLLIALNSGGTFTSLLDTPVAYRPFGLHAADLNVDGFQDLVVTGELERYILTGHGDATFDAAFCYCGTEALGDLDGDGDIDLIGGARFDTTYTYVALYRNNGDNTFAYDFSYDAGVQANVIAVGDLNRDELPDLVACDPYENYPNVTTRTVGVLLGQFGGGFGPPQTYEVGGSYSPTIIDLDADGDSDVLFGDYSNTQSGGVKVMRNLGDGTLAPPEISQLLEFASGLEVADVNGDGLPDALMQDGSGTAVIANRGSAGLAAPKTIPTADLYTQWSELLDVDGDGDQDAVALGTVRSSGDIGISVGRAAAGTMVFDAARPITAELIAGTPLVADLDSDSAPDIVVASAPNYYEMTNLHIRWNNAGDFSSETTLAAATTYYSSLGASAAGDFDLDGKTDFVIGAGELIVYRNQGARAFSEFGRLTSGSYTLALAANDLDGDGDLDLVHVSGDNCKCVAGLFETWINDGTGHFAAKAELPWENQSAISIGDVDEDGIPDIIAYDSQSLSIFYLNSAGEIGSPQIVSLPLGISARRIAVADVDLNGFSDLILSGAGTLGVLPGQGAGAFGAAVFFAIGRTPYGATHRPQDADGDGDLDILLTHDTGAVAILRNLTIP